MRFNSLQETLTHPKKDDYNFTVVFSADEKVQENIQKEFLNFISKAQSFVKEADAVNVFQINFDFFKWG